MDLFLYQLKQAYFSLKQKPGFAFSVVTTMGITLGALLCVLTLAYVMLLKPLPYPEQDRFYTLEHQVLNEKREIAIDDFSYPALINLYEQQTQFSDIAMVSYSDEIIRSHSAQPKLMTGFVSPQWFSMLNTPFVLGRAIDGANEEGGGLEAVISYHSWQIYYAGDFSVIGKKIAVKNATFTIVGVTAQTFVDPQLQGLDFDVQLWLPWQYNSKKYCQKWWDCFPGGLFLIGKMNADQTHGQVEQQLSILIDELFQPNVVGDSYFDGKKIAIRARSLKSAMLGDTKNILFLLLMGAIGLLIIAASNIVNLFIAFSVQQIKSLAIRASLGAKKKDLFVYLLIQAVILMSASLCLSFVVANLGFYVLVQYIHEFLPRVNELNLSLLMMVIMSSIALLLAFLFAKVGSQSLNYQQLTTEFASSGKGIAKQISPRIRNSLIVTQVSITSVLVLVGITSVFESTKVIVQPLGYQRDNINYLSLSTQQPSDKKKQSFSELLTINDEIKSALLSLPEVEKIAIAESPLNGFSNVPVVKEGDDVSTITSYSYADEAYFDLIGQKLLLGEHFPVRRNEKRDFLVIVNDVYAKKHSSIDSIIGKKISLGRNKAEYFTIIGVVKGISEPGYPEVPARLYLPSSPVAAKFMIKVKEQQTLTREVLVKTMARISNQLIIYDYDSLENKHQWIVLPQLVSAITAIIVTFISLFLAVIGLYGILSYVTQMRRFEFATRMAIGAKRKDIIHLLFKDNVAVLVIGFVVGILILMSLYLGFSESLGIYMNSNILQFYLLTIGGVTLLTAIACYLPLRQYINKPVATSLKGCE